MFCAVVMGYRQSKLHQDFQKHITDHDDGSFEMSRGHGKTQQLVARVCFEIGRSTHNGEDPPRVKYVMATTKDSKKTVRQMKGLIESEAYKLVFPKVIPDPDVWSAEEFSVKTKRYRRDATVEASHIFGNAGGRADWLIGDDICNWKNSIRSAAERDQVKDAWSNTWEPTLDETSKRTKITKVGTPYHRDDAVAKFRKYHEADGTLFRRPCVGLVSPWPEVWTPEKLEKKRRKIGTLAYGRAYELEAIDDSSCIFRTDHVDAAMVPAVPNEHVANGRLVVRVDFAFSDKTTLRKNSDPDYSVALLGWQFPHTAHAYAIDMIRGHYTFPEFLEHIKTRFVGTSADRRSFVIGGRREVVQEIRGEDVQAQRELVRIMNDSLCVPVFGIPRSNDKVARAIKCQPVVESGRFHILGQPGQPVTALEPLYDEMTTFPVSGHDDTVDTAIDLMDMVVHTNEEYFGSVSGQSRDRVYGGRLGAM